MCLNRITLIGFLGGGCRKEGQQRNEYRGVLAGDENVMEE
jgi:hypothetical protein